MSANAEVNQLDMECDGEDGDGHVTWQQPRESIKRCVADELHFDCAECREHWREMAQRQPSPTATGTRRKRDQKNMHWYSATAQRMAECHLIAHHKWSPEDLEN